MKSAVFALLISAFLCGALSKNATAEPPTLLLSPTDQYKTLSGYLGYLIDKDSSFTLDEVIKKRRIGDYIIADDSQVAAGFKADATIWLFFRISKEKSLAQQKWWLNAAEHLIDDVTAYMIYPDGEISIARSGRGAENEVSRNPWRQHLIPLDFQDDQTIDVFLAVRSFTALRIAPRIYEEEQLRRHQARDGVIIGGYAGIMALVFLISLIRASRQRSAVDFFYALYISGLTISALINLGANYLFDLQINLVVTHLLVIGGIHLAILALVGFLRTFIRWPQHSNLRINRWAAAFAIGQLLIAVAAWFVHPSIAFAYANVLSLLFMLGYFLAAVWATYRGYKNATLLLVAFLPLIVAVIARVLEGFGLISGNTGTLRLFFLTSLFHAVALMSAMIIRESHLRVAQDKLKWQLLQIERDMENQINLTRILAHEIRTPLAVIDSYSQLMAKDQSNSPSMKERVAHIRQSVLKASNTLTHVLSEDRILDGASMKLERIDLIELIHTHIASAQKETTKHRISFQSKVVACYCMADPLKLGIAIRNLIENAIVYSPKGGAVIISLIDNTKQFVRLTIQDEGVGIAPDQLHLVFGRYFRTNQVKRATGTGLGLYLVKSIVKQHEGEISCSSVIDRGTIFEILLPKRARDSSDDHT